MGSGGFMKVLKERFCKSAGHDVGRRQEATYRSDEEVGD